MKKWFLLWALVPILSVAEPLAVNVTSTSQKILPSRGYAVPSGVKAWTNGIWMSQGEYVRVNTRVYMAGRAGQSTNEPTVTSIGSATNAGGDNITWIQTWKAGRNGLAIANGAATSVVFVAIGSTAVYGRGLAIYPSNTLILNPAPQDDITAVTDAGAAVKPVFYMEW